jgi:hypothetical protein
MMQEEPENLKHFLSRLSRGKHSSIQCHQVDLELDDNKMPEFHNYVGKALRNAYADPDRVATILRREGFDEAANYVRERFPTKDNPFHIRDGDFGEVVTQVLLQDLFRMSIPVIKLRYKTNWQRAAFGIDVIAFRLYDNDPSLDTVVFAEVKASSNKKYGVAKVFQEIEELVQERQSEINQKMRNAVQFVCDRLAEQGKQDLEERLYRFTDCFTNPHYVERFAPVLVRDKTTWSEDALNGISLSTLKPDHVMLVVFRIRDLKQAIEMAYEQAVLKQEGNG